MTRAQDRSRSPAAPMPLTGRVAIVTGGSTGVGRGIALALAGSGAAVVVGYHRDADGAAETCATHHGGRWPGGRVRGGHRDAGRRSGPGRGTAVDTWGRLDVMSCHAGITSWGPFLDVTPAALDEVVATNIRGTFLSAQAGGAPDGGAGERRAAAADRIRDGRACHRQPVGVCHDPGRGRGPRAQPGGRAGPPSASPSTRSWWGPSSTPATWPMTRTTPLAGARCCPSAEPASRPMWVRSPRSWPPTRAPSSRVPPSRWMVAGSMAGRSRPGA